MNSRRILAAVAMLCAMAAPAHAQSTKAQLNAQIGVNFPDNTQFLITPLNVRTVTASIVNSIMPTAPVVSGNFACFSGTTGLLQDCGVSPSFFPVSVPLGGTGRSSITANGVMIGNGTSPILTASPSGVQGCLTSTGAGTPPSFGSTTASQCGPVSYVITVAALKAINVGNTPNVYVSGYFAAGDGGGGWFYGDPASSATDNGGTIIAPNAGSGRWVRNYAGNSINVRWFGAKGDGTPEGTTISNALQVAAGIKGGLYFPASSGCYNSNVRIPDGTITLRIFGDAGGGQGTNQSTGPGSCISVSDATAVIAGTAATGGSISDISIENLRIYNQGVGGGIVAQNFIGLHLTNIFVTAVNGGAAVDLLGVGDFTIDGSQGYGNAGPALRMGLSVAPQQVTNSGPGTITGGLFAVQIGQSCAIVLQGDLLGVVFKGTQYAASGSTTCPGAITVDGDPTSGFPPVGVLTLIGIHGESNWNTSSAGSDVLIGASAKFGTVNIIGGEAHCQGNGTNWQANYVRVVAARSVMVTGSQANKDSSTFGCSTAMFRLESTFPNVGAGDSYWFGGNHFDGSGTMYSDVNSRCSGTASCGFGGAIWNQLTLGSPLAVASGGTGNSAALTVGALLVANGTQSMVPLLDVATGNVLCSGGVGVAPSYCKVAVTAMAAQAANTVLANATSGSAAPTAFAMPSCSAASNAINWTTNTGFGCNSAITATSMAASGLTGTVAVANGGTNCATASGTCLDNITGFALTGFLKRTGAGVYSAIPSIGAGASVPQIDGTLVVPSTKTATVNNTLTFTGTDGSTIPFGTRTRQTFLTGTSLTYTTPANVKYISVRMVGGGGGGGGSGTAGGTGGTGGNTTFSTFTASGGTGAAGSSGGSGGAATGGSFNIPGSNGSGGANVSPGWGSQGGGTPFGIAPSASPNVVGSTGPTNSGAAGGGGGTNATNPTGGGGGSGGYMEFIITAPAAGYTYSVGASAAGGAAGTGGVAGGGGAAGVIIVDEFYQ